jgi:hypothetical protein
MISKLKEYKKYPMPTKSAWDKKSYDPIKWLYNLKKEHHIILEDYFFDPYFSVKNFIKEFFRFIIKLFRWIPIIWKDRDYDDYFIFEILKQKILQQRNYLVKNNRHTNIDQDNFWMTICLNLIERIQDNYYEVEYFDYFDSEIYFTEIGDISICSFYSFYNKNIKNQRQTNVIIDKKTTLIEASLSFIGVGIPSNTVSWGSLLNEARDHFSAWWLVVFPGLCVFTLIFIYNRIATEIMGK